VNKPTRWLLVPVAALLVAGSWRTMMAPGPVGQSHDEWAADCDSCHLVFDGVPDERCLACHTDLRDRIAAGTGWHAEVASRPCIDCHTDHHGLEASLTELEVLKTFDHTATGFPLEGAHGKPSCEDCHEGPIGRLDQGCATCHDDVHSSAMGPVCGACHAPQAWNHVKTKEAHLLDMAGGHAKPGCEDCHTHGEHLDSEVVCADCHPEAHGGTTSGCERCHQVTGWKPAAFDHGGCTCAFPGKHQTAACLDCHTDFDWVNTPTQCAGCHRKDLPHDDLGACSRCHTALSWTENLFDHNKGTTFPIQGAHEEVSCAQCHIEPGIFGGQQTACTSCHAEQGEAAHGDFGPCETCHATTDEGGFSGSSFDHASTGFALEGRHTTLGCRACHGPDGALNHP
jgi:hypothetical protein